MKYNYEVFLTNGMKAQFIATSDYVPGGPFMQFRDEDNILVKSIKLDLISMVSREPYYEPKTKAIEKPEEKPDMWVELPIGQPANPT